MQINLVLFQDTYHLTKISYLYTNSTLQRRKLIYSPTHTDYKHSKVTGNKIATVEIPKMGKKLKKI